ncbi:hypothetical protein [Microseira sp. BLCC-F43]|jgi:hypothetical protein|uniref:hypothetical protein n=1 Tax=Microseira sp. BLCC-F43 TaxID=3153602 RepID=UPI0035BB8503
MFTQLQVPYPTTSLISELITIERGQYIVRASVLIEGVTRATGLAAAETIEQAEDRARKRALEVIAIGNLTLPQPEVVDTSLAASEGLGQPQTYPAREPAFSRHPLEPDNFGRISTDTSWLNDTSPTASSDLTAPVVPLEAVGVTDEFIPDWQGNAWVQNPLADSMPTIGEDSEPTISSSFKKVTPIRSRRHDPDQSLVQPLPSAAEAPDSFEKLTEATDPVDLSDQLARIKSELKRLGWSDDQRNKFLERTYNKKSLSLLNKEEMLEFLEYLQSFAKIDVELKRIGWTPEKGKAHLLQTYAKGSRYQLSPQQLGEFLQHLELQPDPIS